MWMIAFDEIFIDKTKYGVKVQTSEYGEQGKHIIIDQGQTQIAGYTDREDGLFEEVPVVIFGDHTRVIKYVDEPFFLGADGVKVLRSKDNNANYKYLYYALKNAKIPNTGYNRHFKWLKEVIIKYPDRERQDEIVEILDKVSDVIQKRQDELSRLDNLIKARFVEMFGDIITNEKNWRTDNWSNVLKIINGKNQKAVEEENGEYLICGSGGAMGRATEYLTKENSVIVGRKGNINKPILMREKYWNVDTAFGIVPNEEYINVDYLYMFCIFFDFEKLNKAVTIPSLTKADLLNIEMPIPDIGVQNQFADFVHQVDKSKFDTMTFAPIYAIINLYLHTHFYQGRR